MSPAKSKPAKSGGSYRKPRPDVYTVLLAAALVALLLAIICLYSEMNVYQFEYKGGPTAAANRPTLVAMADDGTLEAGNRPASGMPAAPIPNP